MEDYSVEQGVESTKLLPVDQFTNIDGDTLTITTTGLPAV